MQGGLLQTLDSSHSLARVMEDLEAESAKTRVARLTIVLKPKENEFLEYFSAVFLQTSKTGK